MLIRAATGRKLPYGKVGESDILYFIENNAEGLIKARAVVDTVFFSEKLSPEASLKLVDDNQEQLQLDATLKKRFGGKRYITLITIKDFEIIEPFKFNQVNYKNSMDDWLIVDDIKSVKKV